MIEKALQQQQKIYDVKITNENFATTSPNCDATVYKMHGDIRFPNEAVLTKDDYENYTLKHQIFTTALQGDLISKTFLFIGFSFDDPNLEYILSRIRVLLGNSQRRHYCFMKKVHRSDFKDERDFMYAEIRQELKVKDLRRFNIKVLLIDDYTQITTILRELELQYRRRNIFISGSAAVYGPWGQGRAYKFASELSKRIIQNGNNISTGFGLGIGSCILSGALEEIYKEERLTRVDDRLISRPFPQDTAGDISRSELWTLHRNALLDKVGISIFIFGNKVNPQGGVLDANGMEEEFEIGVEKGVVPIPIGSTGFTAKNLWNKVMSDFNRYVSDIRLEPMYRTLGNPNSTDEQIIEAVLNLIKQLEKRRR